MSLNQETKINLYKSGNFRIIVIDKKNINITDKEL